MHVRVHSITRTLFDGEATSLTCPTTSGEITVLAHHRPLLSELKAGMLKIITIKGEESYIPVVSGFLEVSVGGFVSVLTD